MTTDEPDKISTPKHLHKKSNYVKPLKLGTKGNKQWVGEDCLIISHGKPFPFSVIAKTKVLALEIEKQDIMSLFNPNFVNDLIKIA